MRVFTHFLPTDPKNPKAGIRYGTILQFGDSWELIGSVIMKNPGSSNFKNDTPAKIDELNLYDSGDNACWYEFNPDSTMYCIEQLFKEKYFPKDSGNLSGVIRIFNLFYSKEPNLNKALELYSSEDQIIDDLKQIKESINKPIYIGWGSLYRNPAFKIKANTIFEIVKEHNPYLNEDIRKNRFYHPMYLIRYGNGKKWVSDVRESFCKDR